MIILKMASEERNFTKTLSQVDACLVSGRLRQARTLLLRLTKKGRPRRSELAALSEHLRRCGLHQAALKALNRAVRPNPRFPLKASDTEKLIYASILISLGATEEGEELLSKLNAQEIPKVYLYRGYAAIHRWDYEAAISKLQAYIAHPQVDDYARLHGQVNLVACFVFEGRSEEAAQLIKEVMATQNREAFKRLRANLIRLVAMNHFENGEYEEAAKRLAQGRAKLSEVEGLEKLWFVKWENFIAAYTSPSIKFQNECFERVRALARAEKAWEILRDCDYQQGRLQQDFERLTKVYCGTPYPSYRKRLLRGVSEKMYQKLLATSAYDWVVGPVSELAQNKELVDLRNEFLTDPEPDAQIGKKRFRKLLFSLASDFYRPLSVMVLHHKVYPDEYFNPFHSPSKIYQLVHDFRLHLKEIGSHLSVSECDGHYFLEASDATILRISSEQPTVIDEYASLMARLAALPSERHFDAHEAEQLLGLKPRSCRRLLQEACFNGLVIKSGQGRSTRYKRAMQAKLVA